MALIHQVIPVGAFAANCHILADDSAKVGIIVDPGDEPESILEVVRDLGVKITHLVHTHCHLDHISGTRPVKEETGARILIHGKDERLYTHLKKQYASLMPMFGIPGGSVDDPLPVDEKLSDTSAIPFGKYSIQTIVTPGHTPGSCCFLLKTEKDARLFSGDTLFARSIGRTDLEGGDLDQELDSIRTRLMTLDPDTRVFPGHGPETRIGIEKSQNPFLRE